MGAFLAHFGSGLIQEKPQIRYQLIQLTMLSEDFVGPLFGCSFNHSVSLLTPIFLQPPGG
jgi:hypothetical protein